MRKLEQTVAFFALAMGLLLMREGWSYLSRPAPANGLAIVLSGPDGIQKTAQVEFLRRRYGLRSISPAELSREIARDDDRRFLLPDCAAGLLAKQKDLPKPIFIEIADRRLPSGPRDVYLIESYYPDAAIWTVDGTRPPEVISATLQQLLDNVGQASTPAEGLQTRPF